MPWCFVREDGLERTLTRGELRDQVAQARGPGRGGRRDGDRVVALWQYRRAA